MRIVVPSALIACAAIVALVPYMRPAIRSETAPNRLFSAERAFRRLESFPTAPHPASSPAQGEFRDYLVRELQGLGYETRVQASTVRNGPASGLALENVIARTRVPGAEGAILVVSHYDSTRAGPGAGDNGSGVAVLLETLRALREDSPRRVNDIIALFDDGEEYGYTGSQAFIRECEWLSEVRFVVSLDTAAVGPSALLHAGRPNGSAIRSFAGAGSSPTATSFFSWLDEVTGDESDYSPYMRVGIPGVAIEDPTAFAEKHTAFDTVDRINLNSLQDMGDQVLPLTRKLLVTRLASEPADDEVYFPVAGIGLLHYSTRLSAFLCAICLTLAGVALFAGFRSNALSARGLLIGLSGHLVATVVLTILGLATASVSASALRHAGSGALPLIPPEYRTEVLSPLAFASLAVFAVLSGVAEFCACRFLRGKASPRELFAGILPIWGMLAFVGLVFASDIVPHLSWPLVASSLCLLVAFPRARIPFWAVMRKAFAIVALSVPILMLAPVMYLGFLSKSVSTLPFLALFAGLIIPTVVGAWFAFIGDK